MQMTGVTLLCIIEQRTNANFKNLKNVTDINQPTKAVSAAHQVIVTGLSGMSIVFMITGSILLFATITDQEGLVQIFVWVTFLNVLVGFILTFMVGFSCLFRSSCLLSSMDWLSGSALLVMFVAYMFLWIYFIVVANSYVLNVFV
ncbi:uncharacterized protein LOC135083719 isoform X3 [Ostrinia nubilalis]|uniref:uncharacterized protein LOC135083719 isoform X3 n=1 Tax=Ostrinia nubilalis TaxID=29057 RepID=UPI0030823A24